VSSTTLDHGRVGVLGVVTICCYGAWYYSFGVLLDPIIDDTGWRESTLAASFSVGIALIGVASILGGHLLDRYGSRPVFTLAGIIGGGGLLLASATSSLAVFFLGSAVGMGALGAFGFYHITMAAAVRLHPDDAPRAIAVLTIWGAFASPIFLPFSAWLVQETDWRVTSRILALLAMGAFFLGAVFVPTPPDDGGTHRRSLRAVAATAVESREARAFTIAVAFIGISISVILAYQVPVMSAAGLPLTTAGFMAGFRGFAQLGGRLPLSPLVRRVGSRSALLISISAIGLGSVLLAGSGTIVVAGIFAVVAGFGLGAYSPLQGIHAAELFDHHSIGATMGLYTTVSQLAGATGPFMAGIVADQTGDRRWVVVLAAAAAVASVVSLATAGDGHHGGGETIQDKKTPLRS
jgi:MFS family permease